MIEIRKSSIHGKGVFSTVFIPQNTILVCDVIIVEKNTIADYEYPWDGKHSSICIGFGSFFNHASVPNVKIFRIDKINLTKTFITLVDINVGEELTLYYNDKFNNNIVI